MPEGSGGGSNRFGLAHYLVRAMAMDGLYERRDKEDERQNHAGSLGKAATGAKLPGPVQPVGESRR